MDDTRNSFVLHLPNHDHITANFEIRASTSIGLTNGFPSCKLLQI